MILIAYGSALDRFGTWIATDLSESDFIFQYILPKLGSNYVVYHSIPISEKQFQQWQAQGLAYVTRNQLKLQLPE